MTSKTKNTENIEKEITRTWLSGNSSCTLVLPKDFAREYGLDQPAHVIIQKTQEGLLIKKLSI